MIEIRFMAYSETNHDFETVFREGRLIGRKKGDPMLIFGRDILESERNLDVVRDAFIGNPMATIKDSKRGSFTVELTEATK